MSATSHPTAAPDVEATGDEHEGSCFVVGYDSSAASRRAVSWAARALPSDGRLVLVHAGRPLHVPPSPFASPAERRQASRALIDELLMEGDDALLGVVVHAELVDKDPVSALTAAAERNHAAGIVVGCKRHSRLHKALGTVVGELLMRSPVPVIVVPGARSG